MRDRDMEDQLVLYGKKFSSRLLLGTARYESPHQLTLSCVTRRSDECPIGVFVGLLLSAR